MILQQVIAAIKVLEDKGLLNDAEITARYKALLEEGKKAAAERGIQSETTRPVVVRGGDGKPRILRTTGNSPDSGSEGSKADDPGANSQGPEPKPIQLPDSTINGPSGDAKATEAELPGKVD